MDKKEIFEGNKLIAVFMGAKLDKRNGEDSVWLSEQSMFSEYFRVTHHNKYHTHWEWLMPVVEKIDKLDATATSITNICCEINSKFFRHLEVKSIQTISNTKIEATYESVIKFIEWYNKNMS